MQYDCMIISLSGSFIRGGFRPIGFCPRGFCPVSNNNMISIIID
jgi:hypothetical protein